MEPTQPSQFVHEFQEGLRMASRKTVMAGPQKIAESI